MHNITPVDFDNDIPKIIKNKLDQKIYKIAQLEIKKSIKNEGGNLAGASDLTRLIVPVIEKYGIYTDFEREVYSRSKNQPITSDACILFTVITNNKRRSIENSNDRLAVSFDPENPSKISKEAMIQIRSAQKNIISDYKHPKENQIITGNTFNKNDPKDHFSLQVLIDFFKNNPNANIFEYRKYINKLDFNAVANIVKTRNFDVYTPFYIQDKLLKHSVISISGPGILGNLITTTSINVKHDDDDPEHETRLAFIRASYRRSMELPFSLPLIKKTTGSFTDSPSIDHFSWTYFGKLRKEKRIEKMFSAAKTIQSAYQRFKARKRITYDAFLESMLIQKLQKLNIGYIGGYKKSHHQVDALLPLTAEIDPIEEIKKLRSEGITPSFVKTKFANHVKVSLALCVENINDSKNPSAEIINRIGSMRQA